MADSILLNSDSRLLNNFGTADLAHYGAQPDPIVSFAPADTDASPIDPLGIASPARSGTAQPADSDQPVSLDSSLAYLPPLSDAAPQTQGSSAPLSRFDIDTPAARTAPAIPFEAAPTALAGGGSLTPTQFQSATGDAAPASPLAAALTPTSIEGGNIGSASPVVDQLFSNVAALQPPVGHLLSGVDDAVIAPVVAGIVLPVTESVLDPVVSNVAAPVLETAGKVTDQLLDPVNDITTPVGATLGDVTEAAVAPLDPVLTGVGDIAEPVVGTAAAAVAPTLAVVGDAVEPVVAPGAEAAAPVLTPVAEALSPVTDTLAAAVDPLTDAIATPTAEAPAPITGSAIDAGIATLVDLVQASDMIMPPPAGVEPGSGPPSDDGAIVDALASPDPVGNLLGTSDDEDAPDDGDNDGPLGFGGV